MSWNINHQRDKFEGIKFDIDDVRKRLIAQDLFCLQETKGPVTIKDYTCFNANRRGTNTGIRKNLATGVSRVLVPNCDDILIIKLKSRYFNTERDLNIINVYDSPSHGSYKKRVKTQSDDFVSTREHLENCLARIPDSEDAVLVGDFNARTGVLEDILSPCDFKDGDLDPPTLTSLIGLPPRNNQDRTLNANGKPFIELLQTTEMVILNGRTIGDIFGSPTCVQHNGVSTVDYICVSPNLIDRVRFFKVENLTPYSDHRPILTAIDTKSSALAPCNPLPCHTSLPAAPKPFKWERDDETGLGTATKFMAAQSKDQFAQRVNMLSRAAIKSPSDVRNFNTEVISTLNNLAKEVTTQKVGCIRTNKNKWYDWSCRKAKRAVCSLERTNNNDQEKGSNIDPMVSEFHRHKYYLLKKDYRAKIRAQRGKYLFKLNEKINAHSSINWSALKDLSSTCKDTDTFDVYDLVAFHKFFNDLYNKQCQDPKHKLPASVRNEDHLAQISQLEKLNREFSNQELDKAISKLQNNKSVSADLISNEMLKNTKSELRNILLKLFNSCLEFGTYPWNCSITTPLHKKGDKQNPDNYRAITVGSCLGKLFSSLLLDRLLEFRKSSCPDYPNQLGFRSGAQCSDHILSLSTIIEKYTKKKKAKVFACFVDYRKAFDTVCRDALMYKLNSLGIQGAFFSCISDMYSKSTTRIKLIQKLSEAVDVTIGTEQGHPMSPELFKVYIYELSIKLEELDNTNVPSLNGFPVSHLLWADDLILLALDANTLQRQLDCLNDFVTSWELSINISKTNVMVFNSSSRILKCSHGFKLGNLDIKSVRRYCYLGIQFSLNGSFKHAINELRKKALRSFFSLKRMVDTRALTCSTMLKLIDSLVKPVATYACQIWLPSTNILKAMAKPHNCSQHRNLARIASKDSFESTHLKLLKWVLGVHKKTNNNFCYGDTGRKPWALTVLPQCLRYFERVSMPSFNQSDVNMLVHQALQEQKNLKLSWYQTWHSIIEQASSPQGAPQPMDEFTSPTAAACYKYESSFVCDWKADLETQRKMQFYRSVKGDFGEEHYLNLQSHLSRLNIAKIRSSSHDLKIERGRYTKENSSQWTRACRFCCDVPYVQDLENLPFFEGTITETEEHCLSECPMYHPTRSTLSDNLKSLLMLKAYSTIMSSAHLEEFGKFLGHCHRIRNPKSKS